MELSEIAQTTCLIAVSHEHFMKMHDSDAFQWFELFWAMGFVHLHCFLDPLLYFSHWPSDTLSSLARHWLL